LGREFDGEPQTGLVFAAEVIERRGRDFYEQVCSRSNRDALQNGQDYVDKRDEIRNEWKF
jgi:hypothetical protein